MFIHLAAPGLSCGTQDLQSLVVTCELIVAACRIQSLTRDQSQAP